MKKTDWFDGKIKPTIEGPYERKLDNGIIRYWYWSGKQWDFGSEISSEGCRPELTPSVHQEIPWRGLSEPYQA